MMENTFVLNNPHFSNNNIYKTTSDREKISRMRPDFSEVNYSLTAEVGKNFFRYLKSFNLSKDPELLVLPYNNHYYYDKEDLKSVRTLINLKNLNLIKDPDTFLHTLFHILPPNVNFIGCFSESKATLKRDRFLLELSARLINLLESMTDHNMDKKGISEILEKNGFKVVDMTEMDGLTYFYSQNVCQPVKIRA